MELARVASIVLARRARNSRGGGQSPPHRHCDQFRSRRQAAVNSGIL